MAQYLSSPGGAATPGAGAAADADEVFAQKQPQAESDHAEKKKKNDVVITPAGPTPKEKVHRVRPGETIRRNPDGSYSVVPKKSPKKKKKNSKPKEHHNG